MPNSIFHKSSSNMSCSPDKVVNSKSSVDPFLFPFFSLFTNFSSLLTLFISSLSVVMLIILCACLCVFLYRFCLPSLSLPFPYCQVFQGYRIFPMLCAAVWLVLPESTPQGQVTLGSLHSLMKKKGNTSKIMFHVRLVFR